MYRIKHKFVLLIMLPVVLIALYSFISKEEFSSGVISIGVVVKDLDKSVDFYTNVLGMKKTGGFEINNEFGKRSGLTDSKPFSVQVLKLQDSPEATEWKVMSFGTEASHPYPSFIHDDTGMQYVTIFVNSMQPFLERIEKQNVKLLGDTPIKLDEERHFVLIQDPDGNFIELIGPK